MYFFALKNIEPAIASALYTGVGPTAVLALSALGFTMAKQTDTGWLERLGHFGVLASLALAVQLHRPVAGNGAPFGAGLEASHV